MGPRVNVSGFSNWVLYSFSIAMQKKATIEWLKTTHSCYSSQFLKVTSAGLPSCSAQVPLRLTCRWWLGGALNRLEEGQLLRHWNLQQLVLQASSGDRGPVALSLTSGKTGAFSSRACWNGTPACQGQRFLCFTCQCALVFLIHFVRTTPNLPAFNVSNSCLGAWAAHSCVWFCLPAMEQLRAL